VCMCDFDKPGQMESSNNANMTGNKSVTSVSQHDNWSSDGHSARPMITLTDLSDHDTFRDRVLYSEDFDAIQDYVQSTESPMMNLSPSWLRQGVESAATIHVFPTVSQQSGRHDNRVQPPATASVMTSACPTIDMMPNIGSSSFPSREVSVDAVFTRFFSA